MNDINVRDYFDGEVVNEGETPSTYLYEVQEEPTITENMRPFEVGGYIYIPYKIVETNEKIIGDEMLKQFRLEGPAVDPSREVYTENRLRNVFEAI